MFVGIYPLVVFFTSAGALVLEIVAGRLIAPYVGMSLYTWTAIIAVVLAGLSAGHWIGGRLAGAGVSERSISVRITVALVAATAFTLLTLPLLRAIADLVVDDIDYPVCSVLLLTSAYFVGGGGYTLPRSWQRTYPAARLVVAEIDPQVTAAAVEHLWFAPDVGNVEVIHGDARVALQAQSKMEQYDVVFGDAFHDISVPAHLVTDEFAEEVAARLRPGGLFVSNIVDKAPIPMFVFAFVRTLERHFEAVEIWLEEGVAIDDPRVTYIVIASDAPSPSGTIQARHGIERSWVRWPREHLREQLDTYDAPILTDTFAPVERLLFKKVDRRN